MNEKDNIIARYERRKNLDETLLYSPLSPWVYMTLQEKERAIIRWINKSGIMPVNEKRVLEIGCGSGSNLLRLLCLGFKAQNLVGNDLLAERVESARLRLSSNVMILQGEASSLEIAEGSFDIVIQELVFSSILDDAFQEKLAIRMWSFVKPGGGVLWYDFIYDNPRNPDVRGVPQDRIRQLFPDGEITCWRLTLAPPVSRIVTKIHPVMYSICNLFPFLRTHRLCWIKKMTDR